MARGSAIPEDDIKKVLGLCSAKVPAALADEIRLEVTTDDRSISIHECRPIIKGLPREWTSMPIAQLRKEDGLWSLYFGDRYGGWTFYYDLEPTPSIDALIAELEEDPTCVFWG